MRMPEPSTLNLARAAPGIQSLVTFRQRSARGEAAVSRALDRDDSVKATQLVQQMCRKPTLPASDLGNGELNLKTRSLQYLLSIWLRGIDLNVEVDACLVSRGRRRGRTHKRRKRGEEQQEQQAHSPYTHGTRLLESDCRHRFRIPFDITRKQASTRGNVA